MISIKRTSKRPIRRNTKKLPYLSIPDAVDCPLKVEHRMPAINEMSRLLVDSSLSSSSSSSIIDRCSSSQHQQVFDDLLMPSPPMLAAPEKFEKIENYDNYIYEEKYDGERMLAIVFDSKTKKCFTRTLKQSNILKQSIILTANYHHCIFDGELVYLDDDNKIIPICNTGQRQALKVQYRIFDIQMVNGANVMHCPLRERKALLVKCLHETDVVCISRYSPCIDMTTTMQAFDLVCNRGGEGLMLKHFESTYMPNVRKWIKLKSLHLKECREEYELYAHRLKLDKNGIANILDCGYYDANGEYVHVTNVSSGIDASKRISLRLLSNESTGLFKHRVIVTIIADKVTNNKSLRHPIFHRIRNDLETIDLTKFTI